MPYVGCHYLREAFKGPAAIVEAAEPVLAQRRLDCLVGTGLSGALAVPAIATHYGKPFAIVRKAGERNHSYSDIEGFLPESGRWAFVDDFIEGGATMKRVRDRIMDYAESHSLMLTFAGAYLYSGFIGGTWDPCWVPASAINESGRVSAAFMRAMRNDEEVAGFDLAFG